MSGMAPTPPPRPIGYWLQAADEALTRATDLALAAESLSRLECQVLDTLQQIGPTSLPDLLTALRAAGPMERITTAFDRFSDAGLIAATQAGPRVIQQIQLTPTGRERHAAALAIQQQVRERATAGIPESDYATTLAVLERIVRNLAPAPGANPKTA